MYINLKNECTIADANIFILKLIIKGEKAKIGFKNNKKRSETIISLVSNLCFKYVFLYIK